MFVQCAGSDCASIDFGREFFGVANSISTRRARSADFKRADCSINNVFRIISALTFEAIVNRSQRSDGYPQERAHHSRESFYRRANTGLRDINVHAYSEAFERTVHCTREKRMMTGDSGARIIVDIERNYEKYSIFIRLSLVRRCSVSNRQRLWLAENRSYLDRRRASNNCTLTR